MKISEYSQQGFFIFIFILTQDRNQGFMTSQRALCFNAEVPDALITLSHHSERDVEIDRLLIAVFCLCRQNFTVAGVQL